MCIRYALTTAATAAAAALGLAAAVPAQSAEYSSALKIKGVQSKTATVNLKGYKVKDAAGNTFTFRNSHTLQPGDQVSLRGGRGTDSDAKNVVYRQNCNFISNNDKDTIYFY